MRGWLLGKTGKRAAERAQRAETACNNPAHWIRQQYQHLDVRCGSRFAPLGMAETGGNSLQKLCSRDCPQFCCLSQGLHPKSRLA
jgi:hypothetical protein